MQAAMDDLVGNLRQFAMPNLTWTYTPRPTESHATVYHGAGAGNLGGVEATADPWHGRPASAALVLPPTSALWLVPELAE